MGKNIFLNNNKCDGKLSPKVSGNCLQFCRRTVSNAVSVNCLVGELSCSPSFGFAQNTIHDLQNTVLNS